LQREIWPVTVAVLGTTLARVLVTMLPGYVIPERLTVTTPPERLVLAWSGSRGALTIALALALPQQIPERDLLIVMAFGVVLFTLLVQGLTLPLVLRRTGLASVR
jgi:CPA1 family monovalent cation:H+ antiporter